MGLVALVADAVGRARIAGALREVAGEVRFCRTLDEARALLAAADATTAGLPDGGAAGAPTSSVGGGVRALLVEDADADGRSTESLVREVRTRWPHLAVLLYCQPGRTPSSSICALVQAGVHELVLRGIDDERHALRAALRAGEQRSVAALLLDRVRPRVPLAVWPVVECFLRRAAEPVTVDEVARTLGVHRKTLVNRLAAAGCPPPMVVRTWCRLLVVARLLEEPTRTLEGIALQLDFPSGTALRNQLRRHVGCTAQELRARGGLAHALPRFEALLAGASATAGAAMAGAATRDAPAHARRSVRSGRAAIAGRAGRGGYPSPAAAAQVARRVAEPHDA